MKDDEMNKKQGSLLIFTAAVLWSFAGITTKFIPWSAMTIACIRGIIGAITIGVLTKQWVFRPTRAVWLGAIGTLMTSVLFMMANKITTAANAIVLQYLAPAVVIALNILFLRIKPSRIDVMMVGLTISGITLFFVDHLGSGAILGDVLAILSSVTFALVFFANRLPDANPFQASYLGCALHVLLLPMLILDKNFNLDSPSVNIVAISIGIFQMGVAYLLFSKGIKLTTSLSASIISTIEPILNPIWVFIAFQEQPSKLAMLGAIIVIVSITIYNILLSKEQKKLGQHRTKKR